MRDSLLEGKDVLPCLGADPQGLRGTFLLRRDQIGLVPRHHIGNVLLPEQLDELPVTVQKPRSAVHHQYRHIRAVQHLPGTLHALFSQCALIVKARRVDDGHRSHGQKLHCLAHRVGGGSLGIGHHRQLLSRYRIDNAGLSRIAPPKKSDMNAISGGCVIETHGTSS